jgi:hypothetical protein
MQGHSHYFENQGGKRFVEKTDEYFPKTPWGAMGLKFFDYDNDGRPDLFIADMHSDMSQEPGPENEKLKSNITWDDITSKAPNLTLSGAMPSTTTWEMGSLRRSPIAWERRPIGPGDRA